MLNRFPHAELLEDLPLAPTEFSGEGADPLSLPSMVMAFLVSDAPFDLPEMMGAIIFPSTFGLDPPRWATLRFLLLWLGAIASRSNTFFGNENLQRVYIPASFDCLDDMLNAGSRIVPFVVPLVRLALATANDTRSLPATSIRLMLFCAVAHRPCEFENRGELHVPPENLDSIPLALPLVFNGACPG